MANPVDWSQFTPIDPGAPAGPVPQAGAVDWSQFQPVDAAPKAERPSALADNGNASGMSTALARILSGISGTQLQPADVENQLAALGGGASMLARQGALWTSKAADLIAPDAAATGRLQSEADAQKATDEPLRAAQPLAYSAPAMAVTAPLAGGTVARLAAQGAAQAGLTGDDPLTGAGVGVVGGKGIGALGQLVTKGYNAMRGNVNPTVLALQEQAKQAGVPLTAGDIGKTLAQQGDAQGGTGWYKLENALAHIPGSGRSGVLKDQAVGVQGLATDIGDQLRNAAPAAAFPQQAIAADVRDQFATRSAQSSANYAAARNELSQAGLLQPTVLQHSADPIREMVDQFPGLIGDKVSADTRQLIGSVAAVKNGQQLAVDPNDLDKLRSALMEVQRSDSIGMTQTQHGFIKRALDGVNKDETAWFNSLPDGNPAKATLDYARSYHREMVAPYANNATLSKLLDPRNDGDNILGQLGPGKQQAASVLAGALSPEGRAALQSAFYDKVTAPGLNESLQAGHSASRLAKGLNVGQNAGQNQAAANIFSPAQADQIEQLRQLTLATRRSAGWAAEHNTGAKVLPVALAKAAAAAGGGAFLGGVPGAVLPFAAARGANALSTSPAFQRGLYANSLTPEQLAALQAAGGMGSVSLLDLLGQ